MKRGNYTCNSLEICLESPSTNPQSLVIAGSFMIESQCCDIDVSMGTVTNVLCNGDDNGVANIIVTNATGSTTFTIPGIGSNSTGIFNNLPPSNYTATVEDSEGCSIEISFEITEPEVLSCTAERVKYVDCNCQDNGSAIANVTGGTVPYFYLWSNGETTQTATALNIGTYTVEITDSNNCTTTCEIEMEQDPNCCAVIISNGFIRNRTKGN